MIYHWLALNSILLQYLWCSDRSLSYLNALYMDGIIKEPTSLLKGELEIWLSHEECLLHAFEEDWNLMLIIMGLKLCGSQLPGTPAAENAAAPSGVHKHLYSSPKDTLSASSSAGSLSLRGGI